ncbi:MAG: ABC transporter permease [Alphaproteobacteria bacterium]|nr:ABC transporter permease [Alphaproteobacteria bacterium]
MSNVMSEQAEAGIEIDSSGDGAILLLRAWGQWTLCYLMPLRDEMEKLSFSATTCRIVLDLGGLSQLDVSGAWLLISWKEKWRSFGLEACFGNVQPTHHLLLDTIMTSNHKGDAIKERRREEGLLSRLFSSFLNCLSRLGYAVSYILKDVASMARFFWVFMGVFIQTLFRPCRFHFTSFVYHVDHAGFRAVPIVALMSFLLGGILVQQGALQLGRFGAELFVVDLIGILSLREIGVLITVIMFAGRSGSAFSAEIGAMKMREELDAMRVIGIDPMSVLVLPRVLALVFSLPLVAFIADIMCLLGGGLVLEYYVGISSDIYLSRLREVIDFKTFLVGLLKAPVMALIIGIVACLEGLSVENNTNSLGQHVTLSVLKSLFLTVILDSVFAIFFTFIGW